MNWLKIFLGLLPNLITAAAKIEGDVSHHDRKAIVTDSLSALAGGVATAAPAHAQAATDAAAVAASAVEGVYNVIADVKAPAPAPAA